MNCFQLRKNYLLVLFLVTLPIAMIRIAQNPRGVIWSDSEGYYQYLPAVFVVGDVHKMPNESITWAKEKGEYINKYTCGVSYFQAPFYLLALGCVSPIFRTPDTVFTPLFPFQ